MRLAEYLEPLGGKKRQAGVHDCCTLAADWAISCGWPDPMDLWRIVYDNEEEGEDIIASAGALEHLFAQGMGSAGIPEANTPQEGDIGLISLCGKQAGAIFTGKRWAFVPPERGLGFVSLDPEHVLRIWRP